MKKCLTFLVMAFLLIAVTAEAAQTRLQLRTAVRALIHEGDSTNSNYTDAQINDGLNFAMDYLGDALPESALYKLTATTTGSVAINTETANLPTGFKKIISVELYNKQAIPIKLDQWYNQRANMSSTDPMYAILGGSLYLLPASTTGTNPYKLVYMQTPTLLTTDASTITASYDETLEPIVTLVAASYILSLDSQLNKAAGFDALASRKINALSGFIKETNAVEPVKAGGK